MVPILVESPDQDVRYRSLAGVRVSVNPQPEVPAREVVLDGGEGLSVGTIDVFCSQGFRAWYLDPKPLLQDGSQPGRVKFVEWLRERFNSRSLSPFNHIVL